MSDNAFAVYVFHPPILIAITLLLRGVAPMPLESFLLAAALTVPICFLAGAYIFRRVPGLKRIL
jgi:surface polysaccharide O-acyltransferase-like enzyme